ncbi:MAG: hypothetical protein E6Q97_25215 [Desulfurellales bacterium]|nr:MAG: hypothetical protein E6Q97_25215 [Desulfurellales bacterium]
MGESLQERVKRLKQTATEETIADRVARLKSASNATPSPSQFEEDLGIPELNAEIKRGKFEASLGSGQTPKGVIDAAGIPGRAVAASIRSLQELFGGDPGRPWEDVVTGENRSLPLDIIRAFTAPSGTPPGSRGGVQPKAHPSEVLGEIAVSALTDPLNYINPSGPAVKAAKGVSGLEKSVVSGMGRASEIATIGRNTKEGALEALSHFTPKEQMNAADTLESVKEFYGPMKDETLRILTGRIPQSDASFSIKPISIPKKLDDAIENMSVVYDAMRSNLGGANRLGDFPENDVGSKLLSSLMDKITKIKSSGRLSAPQAAEINDIISQLSITPFGNQRAIPGNFESAYAFLQKEMGNAIKESAPELGKGRELYHAAREMNVARPGGKMTSMIRQEDINQALYHTMDAIAHGDAPKLGNILMIMAKSGPLWNNAIGAARIPASALEKGADGVAKYLIENPNAAKLLTTFLNESLKTRPTNDDLDPGNSTQLDDQPMDQPMAQASMPPPMPPQPMATPMPPPIDPKDQALMDLTGLGSVNGGKIQDPMERKRFIDDVEQNHNLTPRERMIIQAKALRDGTIVLPQDLRR